MMTTSQQLCTFGVQGLLFGIPVARVQEVIRYQQISRVPLAPRAISGLINLRGQIVTAIDMRRRLGMADRPADKLPMNVVIRTDDGAVSLLVDEIGDVQQVDAGSFEPAPSTLQREIRSLVRGAYKLENRLLFVLDTAAAVDLSDERADRVVEAA